MPAPMDKYEKAFKKCLGKLRVLQDTLLAYKLWLQTTVLSRIGNSRFKKENVQNPTRTQRHLALIAWHFPPSVDAGVYRPAALVKYGAAGWKISVISGPRIKSPSPAGESLLRSLPEGYDQIRVENSALIPSYSCFPKIHGGFLNSLTSFSTARAVLSSVPPAIVMATGPPFLTFVSAFYLARYFRAKLVLDYRDEWTECPFPFVDAGNFDLAWEGACLRAADAVLFTTRSQLEHQVLQFPGLNPSKCEVVANGWEPADFDACSDFEAVCPPGNQFSLSYVGNLGDHVAIEAFLSDLAYALERNSYLIDRLQIKFIGNKSERAIQAIAGFEYPQVIESIDHMTKTEANKMMRSSSALLLINDLAFERYLPGKVYDYVATGRPILVLGDRGEISDLVSSLNVGMVAPMGNPDKFTETLVRLVESPPRVGDNTQRNMWLKNHTRASMSQAMLRIFEGILGNTPKPSSVV